MGHKIGDYYRNDFEKSKKYFHICPSAFIHTEKKSHIIRNMTLKKDIFIKFLSMHQKQFF